MQSRQLLALVATFAGTLLIHGPTSLFAQDAEAPEPDRLIEAVVEGDKPDKTVEEVLDEIHVENQRRMQEYEARRKRAEAESSGAPADHVPEGSEVSLEERFRTPSQ